MALGLVTLATLLGSACAQGPDHDDDQARLAVVFVGDSGLTQTVGSDDVATGELTFVGDAQDDLGERVGDAGYRALVDDAGELVEVDGVAAPRQRRGAALRMSRDDHFVRRV